MNNTWNYDLVIDIIKNVGNIIKESWGNCNIVSEKSSYNYVTDMDLKVQNYIIEEITKINISESLNFISEETEINEYSYKNTWIIDPIDGTTNYIHRYPHFSISVAHVVDNEIVFSVIHNPILNELYTAQKGKGAYLNNKKINVSTNKELSKSIVGVGFPYDRETAIVVFDLMKKLYMKCQDIKRKGSASLDLAYVACGRLDAYFELDLKLWDIAAGYLLVLEAGGNILGFDKNLNKDQKRYIIASNNFIDKELSDILKLEAIN